MCFIRLKRVTENDKMGRKRNMYTTDEQCMQNIISNPYAA